MLLYLNDFKLISKLSKLVGFYVLFDIKVPSFAVTELAALFRKGESMVSRQNVLPKFYNVVVMPFSHVP